jgi:hypothetical protein
VNVSVDANGRPTSAIFVAGSGTVPFDPGNNRVFVRFKGSGSARRVAVRTR